MYLDFFNKLTHSIQFFRNKYYCNVLIYSPVPTIIKHKERLLNATSHDIKKKMGTIITNYQQ